MSRMVLIKAESYPKAGDRIEFASDRMTDKGPSSGTILSTKITVDGLYVKVQHSDAEETMSWDDLSEHAERTKADDGKTLWMIKAIPVPVLTRDHEPTAAQKEAGNYKVKRRDFAGMSVSIENPAGSYRRGQDPGGAIWETRMIYDYGYIRGTLGVDGDHVDCYLGPNEDAPMVYVIHQRRYGDWDKFDEDKCMLGFDSEEDAVAAYLKHYDDPRFLGPVTPMPIGEFQEKVMSTRDNPQMIKGMPLILKAHVKPHTRKLKTGKVITVRGYTDKRVKKPGSTEKQMDMFGGAKPGGSKRQVKEPAAAPRKSTLPPDNPEDSVEEAINTFAVDLPDMLHVAESLAAGVLPGDGKPIPSEGWRQSVIAELEHLRDSVASAAESVGDLEVAAEAHRAVERANQVLAESQPIPPPGDAAKRKKEPAVSHKPEGPSEEDQADPRRKYYVTMIRDGKPKPAYLAGPFDSHDDAKDHVEHARKKAEEVDPRSVFDAFGTSGLVADKHPPGVLNQHLGMGDAPKAGVKYTGGDSLDDYWANSAGESVRRAGEKDVTPPKGGKPMRKALQITSIRRSS